MKAAGTGPDQAVEDAHEKSDDTQRRIKTVAQRLFAERGIDGVSVRDIVAAAGQRNNGSLHYYFRTKEALVRELIVDTAKLINQRQNAILDSLERDGGPKHLREVIEALVRPGTGASTQRGEEENYIRFIAMLQMNHRKLLLDALERRWDSAYRRSLAHIRRLVPEIPKRLLNQRLVFLGVYLYGTLSMREAALDRGAGSHRFWDPPFTLENLIDTMQSLIEGPVSMVTRSALERAAVEPDGPSTIGQPSRDRSPDAAKTPPAVRSKAR